MLYVSLGSALVYFFSMYMENAMLYEWLAFDRDLILKGQLWRLFSYALTDHSGNLVLSLIGWICY